MLLLSPSSKCFGDLLAKMKTGREARVCEVFSLSLLLYSKCSIICHNSKYNREVQKESNKGKCLPGYFMVITALWLRELMAEGNLDI